MDVCVFEPKYRSAFKELNLEWIQKYFRVEKKDIEQVENPESCLAEGGQIFFVVEKGVALGTCAMYFVSPGVFELAKMAVAPNAQGRGYGDLLMKAAEEWARGEKAKEIIILSNTVLEPAISLYKKHGFETIKLGPHPDYERCDIVMRKLLK